MELSAGNVYNTTLVSSVPYFCEIQQMLEAFFWSGHHRLRGPVLYLPEHEGGSGW